MFQFIYLLLLVALCECLSMGRPYSPYQNEEERPKSIKVFYKLFSSEIPDGNEISLDSYGGVVFDPTAQYKFLLHGATKNLGVYWYRNATEEYLKKVNVNVITAEYPEITQNDTYSPATSRRGKLAGISIGKLIVDLHENKKIPYENIHLIGHGVGAQVAAIAAETVFNLRGEKIGRITALDPIMVFGYQFAFTKAGTLDEKDADFVDSIHTGDSGFQPTGGVDFYPNGGTNQPGCNETSICSHILATGFFIHSINNDDLIATKCDDKFDLEDGLCEGFSKTVMGENVDLKSKGIYQLKTDEKFGIDVLESSGLLKKKVVYQVEITV